MELSPSVVPGVAFFAAVPAFAPREEGFEYDGGVFAQGVEMNFAGGGEEGMAMEDDEAAAGFAGEDFEAFAEVDFFGGVEFAAEAAEFPEGVGLAEDEGAGEQSEAAADAVPKFGEEAGKGEVAIETDGGAAGEAVAAGDLPGDFLEEFGAGVGIGIDEDEPIAGGSGSAGISGPGDLVVGLEDDFGAGVAGEFGGAVGGIVVADDDLSLPIAAGEWSQASVNVMQRFAD